MRRRKERTNSSYNESRNGQSSRKGPVEGEERSRKEKMKDQETNQFAPAT